jgi:hypothetical protein
VGDDARGGGVMQTWEIRTPGGAAGVEFARARIEAHTVVLVHALPAEVEVEIRADDGSLVARTEGLKRTQESPMARLRVEDGAIVREDLWPDDEHLGTVVILGGGEAGVLERWWNAPDRSEWRWAIELYNHR